jgi:hypothetical protein
MTTSVLSVCGDGHGDGEGEVGSACRMALAEGNICCPASLGADFLSLWSARAAPTTGSGEMAL